MSQNLFLDIRGQSFAQISLSPFAGEPVELWQMVGVAAEQNLGDGHRFEDFEEAPLQTLMNERVHQRDFEITVGVQVAEPGGFADEVIASVYGDQLRHPHDAVAIEANDFFEEIRMLSSQDDTRGFT